MTRLVFVRHGAALATEGRCIGHTDVPLSPEGTCAVQQLVTHEPPPTYTGRNSVRVLSSDLRRAVGSATVIASALGCDVEYDAQLREMNFGRWDGQPWTAIERDDPARFHEWMEQWIYISPPGGESAASLAMRASQWIRRALPARTADERIVVVSHAGWIRAALTHLLRRDLAQMFDIRVEHARATIVDVSPKNCVVVATNASRLNG